MSCGYSLCPHPCGTIPTDTSTCSLSPFFLRSILSGSILLEELFLSLTVCYWYIPFIFNPPPPQTEHDIHTIRGNVQGACLIKLILQRLTTFSNRIFFTGRDVDCRSFGLEVVLWDLLSVEHGISTNNYSLGILCCEIHTPYMTDFTSIM